MSAEWANNRPPRWLVNDGHSDRQLQRDPLALGLLVREVGQLYGRISFVPLKGEVSCWAPLKHDQNPYHVTRDTPRDLGLSGDKEALTITAQSELLSRGKKGTN